ncbi:MAG: hypothetical protein Q8T13_04900 [Acidobacteriota bacterium]|nr:hypothetical protein [Acidobacteriota bacterium]
MDSPHGLNVDALPADLATFTAQAEAMERLAVAGLRVAPERLNAREKVFAAALQRHAKGLKVAAAAWQIEIAAK